MPPHHIFATFAFLGGAILLLGWLYLTTENRRSSALLVNSVWLFILPGAAIVALPNSLFLFPLSLWVAAFIEEGLKSFAATTEKEPLDRFWLISLFGIWELMLAKPFAALPTAAYFDEWDRAELLGLSLVASVAVLMHMVTAAIYAFYFRGRLWAALLASWIIHGIFNEIVSVIAPSALVTGLILIILIGALMALWPTGQKIKNEEAPPGR